MLLVFSLFPYSTIFAGQPNDRPNILFIAIDDLNDWIGVMNGHPQVHTPNIDRLARRGTLFTNAHTQAPLCNPSRVSLLTGLRPSTTGIYGLSPRHRQVDRWSDLFTLPQYFASHGYRTYGTGKIFHNSIPQEERKIEFETVGPHGNFGPLPEERLVQEKLDMIQHPLIDWGVYPSDEDTIFADYKVASWAVKQLKTFGSQPSDQPFFLAAGFFRPHVPLFATQKWFDLYPPEQQIELPAAPPGDRRDIPDFAWYLHWFLPEPRLSWLQEHDEWHNKVRSYLASVSFVDAQVGRVLDELEAQGLDDETIVVLWSDHGYHLGEKAITGKNTLWEPSTRVPLIFAGPGTGTAERSGQAVELLDIYPTLVELAGLPAKQELEGLSLVPQLTNPDTPRERPAITTHNPGNHAVRTERWRYIRYANGTEELYDLRRDLHEWSNLADDSAYTNIKRELSGWLPEYSAPHAPGSRHRILENKNGTWYWEGEPISFEELIR
ncbi:MAG: sulfatase [Balneolaceae bacterium]|nr:sulfatase [Balneolaceae bacterium]